jgi:putative addiction module killer protein
MFPAECKLRTPENLHVLGHHAGIIDHGQAPGGDHANDFVCWAKGGQKAGHEHILCMATFSAPSCALLPWKASLDTVCPIWHILSVQIKPGPYAIKELEIGRRKPFSDWFRHLKDKEAKAAILGRLDRIAEHGNFGDYRYLGDEVFELKIPIGPGYRIYWGLEQSQMVLLVLGGDKSTQSRDIATAKTLWKRYKQEATDA